MLVAELQPQSSHTASPLIAPKLLSEVSSGSQRLPSFYLNMDTATAVTPDKTLQRCTAAHTLQTLPTLISSVLSSGKECTEKLVSELCKEWHNIVRQWFYERGEMQRRLIYCPFWWLLLMCPPSHTGQLANGMDHLSALAALALLQ